MRDALIAVLALLVVTQGLAVIRLRRRMHGMQARLDELARRRAAAINQLHQVFDQNGDDQNGEPRRRHLWLVPAIVGLAAWVKTHPGPTIATTAAVGAITLAALIPSATPPPDRALPEPRPPVSTSELTTPSRPPATSTPPTLATPRSPDPTEPTVPAVETGTTTITPPVDGGPSPSAPTTTTTATTTGQPDPTDPDEPGEPHDDRGCLMQLALLDLIYVGLCEAVSEVA